MTNQDIHQIDQHTELTAPTTPAVASSKPKTGWDISPQNLTTTVKRHKIKVYFEDRGDGCFFEFCGPAGSISETGYHSESISDRALVRRKYLNPGVWADFRAESLYSDYQQSLIESNQTSEQLSIKFSSTSQH